MEDFMDIKHKLMRAFRRIIEYDIYDYQDKNDLRNFLIKAATEAIDAVLDSDPIINQKEEN